MMPQTPYRKAKRDTVLPFPEIDRKRRGHRVYSFILAVCLSVMLFALGGILMALCYRVHQ